MRKASPIRGAANVDSVLRGVFHIRNVGILTGEASPRPYDDGVSKRHLADLLEIDFHIVVVNIRLVIIKGA